MPISTNARWRGCGAPGRSSMRAPCCGFTGSLCRRRVIRISCVFHGPQGCTLDRTLRSDVCNSYFCGGLGHFVKGADSAANVVVVAGEGETLSLARGAGEVEVR